MPMAHGHVTTSSATATSSALSGPAGHHTASPSADTASTVATQRRDTPSQKRVCRAAPPVPEGARRSSATSGESVKDCAARTRTASRPALKAPAGSSPSRATARSPGSPVIQSVDTRASASSSTASTGTRSPGSITSTSPSPTSAARTV